MLTGIASDPYADVILGSRQDRGNEHVPHSPRIFLGSQKPSVLSRSSFDTLGISFRSYLGRVSRYES